MMTEYFILFECDGNEEFRSVEIWIWCVDWGVTQEMRSFEKISAFVEVSLDLKSVEGFDIMVEVEGRWHFKADFPRAGRGLREGLASERGPALDSRQHVCGGRNSAVAVGTAAKEHFSDAVALQIIVYLSVRADEEFHAGVFPDFSSVLSGSGA